MKNSCLFILYEQGGIIYFGKSPDKETFMKKEYEKKDRITSSSAPEEYRYLTPCSAQDMTGLIPSGPVGEKEMEDYEEL